MQKLKFLLSTIERKLNFKAVFYLVLLIILKRKTNKQ